MKDIKWCNDEPVKQEPNAFIDKDNGLVCAKCFGKFEYPQYKDLTDEEIFELASSKLFLNSGRVDYKGFAKAILRKAQEK